MYLLQYLKYHILLNQNSMTSKNTNSFSSVEIKSYINKSLFLQSQIFLFIPKMFRDFFIKHGATSHRIVNFILHSLQSEVKFSMKLDYSTRTPNFVSKKSQLIFQFSCRHHTKMHFHILNFLILVYDLFFIFRMLPQCHWPFKGSRIIE